MPAGLLIGALSWLASHLIVITLAGFVGVGLWVFGVIGTVSSATDQTPQATTMTPRQSPAARQDDAKSHVAAGKSQPAETAGKAASTAGAGTEALAPKPATTSQNQSPAEASPRARQPKLIGSSLPIYDVRPRLGGSAAQESTDGFRPSSDIAGTFEQPLTREQGFEHARRAFWNGDFEGAESAYMDLIANDPEDPDAYGELGNLYESMGKPALAADAFFEAGRWLKRRGETRKLRHVIEFLSKKGDERAQQLEFGER